MHTVTGEIDVRLPVQTVCDQWTQFEDFPRFMSGVDDFEARARALAFVPARARAERPHCELRSRSRSIQT